MRTYYVAGIPYSDTELNHMGVSDVQWDKSDELYHYGIKGQQWGKRRFVDYDGKLTSAGRRRYGIEEFQPAANTNQPGSQGLGGPGLAARRRLERTKVSSELSKRQGEYANTSTASKESKAMGIANTQAKNSATKTFNNQVKDTLNAGKQWANQVGQNVSNTVSNAASDVANWATGNKDAASYEAEAAKYREMLEPDNLDPRTQAGLQKRVDQNENAAQAARDNSFFGRIGQAANNVGNWVGTAANNVGNWVGTAANNAGNWVGDNLGIYNAANWVGDRASDVANYFTGNRDNAEYNRLMAEANKNPNAYAQQVFQQGAEATGYQQPAFLRDVTNVGNWVGDRASDAANWLTGNRDYAERMAAAQYQPEGSQAYNAIVSDANRARANSALGRVGQGVTDAWNLAGNATNTVGNWIGQNAQNVSNWADQTSTTARARLGDVAAINTVTNNNSKVRDYSDVIQKIPLGDKETMSIYGEQSANLRNQVADAYRNNDMATVSQLVAQADALDAQINDIADFYRPKK